MKEILTHIPNTEFWFKEEKKKNTMDLHIFLQISKYYHNSFCWISFLLHLPCHIFCSGGSQTSAHIRIFRGVWKHRYLGPSPESPIHQAWDWTNEFAFLTSCQVTSVGTHFQCNWYLHLMIEKHILISAYVVITWHSDMPYSTVPSFLFLVISIYLSFATEYVKHVRNAET